MILLTLQFLLAHILGDFMFQPTKWVQDKIEHKFRSPKLYLHILLHALFLILALQFDFSYWFGILIILISHFLIDLGKLYAYEKINSIALFFIDQFLHLTVILSVVYYYEPFAFSKFDIYNPHLLLLIVSLLMVTAVTSILMKVLISNWKPEEENEESLKNAGVYIGMLERLFIFGFIIMNYWSGVGFLLAAKSVFRFGDLSKAKNRNLTEYILIGTLLSFGLATLIALGYNYLSGMINIL